METPAPPPLARPLHAPQVARRMRLAARAFLDTLGPDEHRLACFRFSADERTQWTYLPGPRPGLRVKDMTAVQREAAFALLDAALSPRGAAEARAVMALERILGEAERRAGSARRERDPELYWIACFGQPDDRTPWAWRLGGHHLGVHVTVVAGGYVAVTPCFLGANPATVRHGPERGQRTLAAEEDLARALLAALDPAQRALAIVEPEAPPDIRTSTWRHVHPGVVPAGVSWNALAAPARELLARLLRHYVDRVEPDLAACAWRRIETAGLDAVTFAWAGPEAPGRGHYYAVEGPTVLIEYDNTQNDANHVHAVWRDFTDDWGEDVLAAHYDADHG